MNLLKDRGIYRLPVREICLGVPMIGRIYAFNPVMNSILKLDYPKEMINLIIVSQSKDSKIPFARREVYCQTRVRL